MTRHDFDPGPLADVHTIAEGDRWAVVFVRHMAHPPAAVWGALTEPAQLARWAPFTADRDLTETGPATLTTVDRDTAEEMPAEVTRSEPPFLLEYTWADDLLRWEVAAAGDGSRLTLRHTMADRAGLPKVAAGWHLCLVVADRLLAGEPIDPITGEDAVNYGWDELHDAYASVLLADSRPG
jgi:uncharacterized protein YndB with AHSA1/START domain